MNIKFYGEPCERVAGKWQVVATRDDSGRTFLLADGLTRKAALEQIKIAEKAALLAGAVVIA